VGFRSTPMEEGEGIGLRKYAFSNRVVDHWNALSDACVTKNTINQFKHCLKRELQPETHS